MANLITAQEVIELAFAENSNMREESISDTSIRIAEIKYIKPVFGNMYSMLGTTYATFTKEYIKPALAYFVKCEIVSSIAIDMSNSGIAVANPQYQSAASDKQRQRLYDSEMGKAKVLLDDALAYISAHAEEFPDFVGTTPKKHFRYGGIIIGGGATPETAFVKGNTVGRSEFDKLSDQVAINTEAIADLGDNTIIVDYDRIAELKNSEEGEDVTHPEIAELVEKIYNEQEKLILIRHFADTYEQLDPTYFVPDTNYGRDEFGDVIITLFASYTPTYNTYGEQSLIGLEVSITQAGAIIKVEQTSVTLLNEESVIDNLNSSYNKKPLSAKQGKELDRKKVGYAEYDSENKAIMLYSDNTKKYALGEIPIESISENGNYPKMTVGKADNLVGRGEATPEEFSFRPSAGDVSIEDGTARITSVKGNSVVWNQLVDNADFRNDTTNWRTSNGTLSVANELCKFTSSGGSACFFSYFKNYIPSNHKVLVMVDYQRASSDHATFGIYLRKAGESNSDTYVSYSMATNSRNTLCAFMTTTAPIERVIIYPMMNLGAGYETTIYSVSVIDLTQMFSAGNEPTSYEEYLQRKPMNIEDEFAYNKGELIDMKVDSLVSTSDNAYDYTKEYARVMGGHTYDCSYGTAFVEKVYFSTNKDNIVAEENAMTSENGKYIFPSDGYAVPYTTDGDKREYCVCLQHTYDKPHPPYQQEVKDLSWISEIKDSDGNEIFENGLMSAGTAYDEVSYNRTTKKWEVVKRIGEINLWQMDWRYDDYRGINCTNDSILNIKVPTNAATKANILTTLYVTQSLDGTYLKNVGISIDTRGRVWVYDNAYTGAEDVVAQFVSMLTQQKAILYYELAEPIITPIENSENLNLDYLVWDFGTEEAIASVPSAPFRADIIYQFNAVDRIRNNDARIAELEAAIKQLQSQIATITIN